mgnify:CR=1 FL=1
MHNEYRYKKLALEGNNKIIKYENKIKNSVKKGIKFTSNVYKWINRYFNELIKTQILW